MDRVGRAGRVDDEVVVRIDRREIEEVLETPNHDVYVTPKAMIPAHPDFIVSRDMEAKVITVRDVEGLMTE